MISPAPPCTTAGTADTHRSDAPVSGGRGDGTTIQEDAGHVPAAEVGTRKRSAWGACRTHFISTGDRTFGWAGNRLPVSAGSTGRPDDGHHS
jgi:IS5 family transposase